MDITRRSSNPAEIVDPTSVEIVEARRATFGTWWPYDGKKGWKCKMEKMVEAGWYFCPNDESDDFVSCAYCDLGLDGWERGDDPFYEHYRRSPECSFFHFAPIPGKKGTKGRSMSSRSSKASRVSTQSTLSAWSEVETTDLDSEMEHSLLSQPAKNAAKSTKGRKGRKPKLKKDEMAENSGQENDPDHNTKVAEPQAKKQRERKRKSSEMTQDQEPQGTQASSVVSGPAAKRRDTGARKASTAKSNIFPDGTDDELNAPVEPVKVEKQTTKKTTKKRSTSTNRVPSATSKALLKSQIPDDAEIEAELEADLKRDSMDYIQAKPAVAHKDYISKQDDISSTETRTLTHKGTKRNKNAETPQDHIDDVEKPGRKRVQGKKKTAKKSAVQRQNEEEVNSEGRIFEAESDAHMDIDGGQLISLERPKVLDETLDTQSSEKIRPLSGRNEPRSNKSDAHKQRPLLDVDDKEQPDSIFDENQRSAVSPRATNGSPSGLIENKLPWGSRSRKISERHTHLDRTAHRASNPAPSPQTQERTPSPSPQSKRR
ncbi:predicted protein [Uncinocarpus reesii 1704]|uniref:Uncharacterized protein n=1 Tax=Uncinocarpus reesii (strain UAMH 1704) TaxID=336963 RepID=C4JYD7_UNCRE|nr:uncharacterized protein UREG_07188 [Uncinocarpus reesii 1704]EEP82323.1 predicted protein [Uncinocarpus reesii 1704]